MCGAFVIDSMPPATTTDADPALMRSWPSITAFMPEPQTLLIVVAPVETGMPAAIDACRAGAWPRLPGSTQPMITSETSPGATPDCSSAALIAVAPSVGVGTPVNWPRKEPIAVRLAPTMTMSDMGRPLRFVRGSAPRWTIMALLLQCGKQQYCCREVQSQSLDEGLEQERLVLNGSREGSGNPNPSITRRISRRSSTPAFDVGG